MSCQHSLLSRASSSEWGLELFWSSPPSGAKMGQQFSGQAMTRLPEKLIKHVGLVRDSGYLTYDEFLGRVAELNDV